MGHRPWTPSTRDVKTYTRQRAAVLTDLQASFWDIGYTIITQASSGQRDSMKSKASSSGQDTLTWDTSLTRLMSKEVPW